MFSLFKYTLPPLRPMLRVKRVNRNEYVTSIEKELSRVPKNHNYSTD
jgi:hypothetical protein